MKNGLPIAVVFGSGVAIGAIANASFRSNVLPENKVEAPAVEPSRGGRGPPGSSEGKAADQSRIADVAPAGSPGTSDFLLLTVRPPSPDRSQPPVEPPLARSIPRLSERARQASAAPPASAEPPPRVDPEAVVPDQSARLAGKSPDGDGFRSVADGVLQSVGGEKGDETDLADRANATSTSNAQPAVVALAAAPDPVPAPDGQARCSACAEVSTVGLAEGEAQAAVSATDAKSRASGESATSVTAPLPDVAVPVDRPVQDSLQVPASATEQVGASASTASHCPEAHRANGSSPSEQGKETCEVSREQDNQVPNCKVGLQINGRNVAALPIFLVDAGQPAIRLSDLLEGLQPDFASADYARLRGATSARALVSISDLLKTGLAIEIGSDGLEISG